MIETFEEHRPLLFSIAYRILGSAADAEDILQEAWLRWDSAPGPVASPRAYLVRTVTNLSLNRLRSAAAQRESYVGPWLPEPLVTAPEATERAEVAESVSLAMLVLLETLSPLERAVFVLKDVFGFSYREIAGMLDRSEAAVRQVGHRARSHVHARRPRFDASAEVRRRVTEEFLAACQGADLSRMMELLAPDVTAWTDGGGKVPAALRPLHGAGKVARWLLAVMAGSWPRWEVRDVDVNGMPGLVVTAAGVPEAVVCLDVSHGRIAELRIILNPDKLRHIGQV